MMLVQKNVDLLKRKKAVSSVVVAILLVVVAIFLIMVFWNVMKGLIKKSPELNCFDLSQSFSIQKACYISEEEVKVDVKRGLDDMAVEKLRFVFSPSSAVWEISGKKCLDARTKEKYGGYCDIVSAGASNSYVFNMTGLEKQENVKIAALDEDNVCVLGEVKIHGSC